VVAKLPERDGEPAYRLKHINGSAEFTVRALGETAQRFGAFVLAQNFQQDIYADRDQDGADRNKCFSGHFLTPPERDRRRITLITGVRRLPTG
jgi:hypothetical protein